jgi:two-component system cell cycle sensor histidine kinase/response regulator CckA
MFVIDSEKDKRQLIEEIRTLRSRLARLESVSHDTAIDKSEEQQELILQAAMDGFWMADVKGRLLKVNETYCRMSGYSEQELLTMCISDLEVVETSNDTAGHIQKIMANGEDRFETRHRRKDSSIFDVEVSVQYRSTNGGRLVAFLRDIMDRKQAEDALKASESRFRGICEASNVGIAVGDINANVIFANEAFRKLVQYSAEELSGMNFTQFTYPDDAKREVLLYQDLLSGRRSEYRLEKRYVTKSKSIIWVDITVSMIPDKPGLPLQCVGVVLDITDRKLAVEALSDSRETLNLILDTVPQSIFWKDLEGRYLGCNRVFAAAAGMGDPMQIVGKTDFDLPWPREEAEAYRADDREVIENNRPKLHIIEPLQQADGKRLFIDTSKVPLRDVHGRSFALLGVYEDITERKLTEQAMKQAQEALEDSEERYRTFIEQLQEGITLIDEEGRIIIWNAANERISGIKRSEVLGKYFWDVMYYLLLPERRIPERCEELKRLILESLKTGVPVFDKPQEVKTVRSDGNIIYSLQIVFPIKTSKGFRFGSITHDITERKQAQEREKFHQLELAHAGRLSVMGQMATEIAHELNQPLCAILSYAESSLRAAKSIEPKNDRLMDSIQTIIKQVERAGSIVSRVKGFARKSTGEWINVHVNEVVSDALGMVAAELKQHSIEIELDLEQDLQPILADMIQIEQVVLNLIQNSIDVLKKVGQSKRKLAITTGSKDGKIEVSVTDYGGGIDDNNIEKIFEPFFTTKPEGLGVGLSISRSIAESHGGNLNFRDNSNDGVTFYFTLPINGKEHN